MGNFQGGGNRGGGFRGGNGGGGRPSFGGNRGGGDRGPVTMHKAVCDECHKGCEVPFRPSQDKPVYCNDCFGSKRDDSDRAPRREFSDRGPKREFNDRPSQLSFTKSTTAPVQDDTKKQLSEMSIKLDRLINIVEKLVSNKAESKSVVKEAPVVLPKKIEIKKVVAVKKVIPTKAPAKKVVVKKVVGKKK